MSRQFNGSSDAITFNPGGAANVSVAGMAIGILWKPLSSHRGGYFDGYNTGGFRQLGINPFDNGSVFFARNGGSSINYDAYLNTWAQLWWTCPSAGGTVRTHLYRYDTGLWAHADQSPAGTRDPLASLLVGSFDSGQFLHARVGLLAIKNANLTDSQLETSSCVTQLQGWLDLAPASLLSFHQTVNTDPVVDLIPTGATQTASTNPAISADEPAGFSYSLGIDTALAGALPGAPTGAIAADATAQAAMTGTLPAAPSAALTVLPTVTVQPLAVYTRPGTLLHRRNAVETVATRTGTLVYRRD